MENIFMSMDNGRLYKAFLEYEELRKTGFVPEGGILAPIRDNYCEHHPASGVHVMEMDLLYAIACRGYYQAGWITEQRNKKGE